MATVLVTHPYFGTVWLEDAYIQYGHVIGHAWAYDRSSLMPDDYRGEYTTLNFPIGCVRVSDLAQIVKCRVSVGAAPYFHFCNNKPKLSCYKCKETVCVRHSRMKHQHGEPNNIILLS